MAITTLGDNFKVVIEGGAGARFAGLAEASADVAVAAAGRSEDARDIAQAAVGVDYADASAALAGASNGDKFTYWDGDEIIYSTKTAGVLVELAGPWIGADKVGADDGHSGSLFTTSQGFIEHISSSGGASSIGFLQEGAGATPQTLEDKFRLDACTPHEFKALSDDFAVDAGPAIRKAMATGKPVRFPKGIYVVQADPASIFSDGGTPRFGWCIKPPANSVLIFEEGSVIKAADGLQNWTRVVSFANSDNTKVFGVLEVDGNVDNIGTPNNEHMHAIMLYDTKNFYAETLIARNARGDGIGIFGTDLTNGSTGYINRIISSRCGRKCLAANAFDFEIGSAHLDNSEGGAQLFGGVADNTDGNCLDIEPDAVDPSMEQSWLRIGSLYTKGAGNDFTGDITGVSQDKVRTTIGSWRCEIVPRSSTSWLIYYGGILEVGNLSVTGITTVCQTSQIFYAGKIKIGNFFLRGAASSGINGFLNVSQVSGYKPTIEISSLDSDTSGATSTIYAADADVKIGKWLAKSDTALFWLRGLSGTSGLNPQLHVETLVSSNSGNPATANYLGLITTATSNIPICYVGRVEYTDSRATKIDRFFYLGANASQGLTIASAEIDNATTQLIAGDGPEKYYKLSGTRSGPSVYVSIVNPEGSVPAPVGSMCIWSGTSLHKKSTGTGNTGWAVI